MKPQLPDYLEKRQSLRIDHSPKEVLLEKINQTFDAADADLVGQARAFLAGKKYVDDSVAYKAADLLFEQKADAVAIAASLLAPLLWQNLTSSDEMRSRFGAAVADTLENLRSSFTSHDGDRPYAHTEIQEILGAIDGSPRSVLFSGPGKFLYAGVYNQFHQRRYSRKMEN